jgi:outer membrane immunogenic protein
MRGDLGNAMKKLLLATLGLGTLFATAPSLAADLSVPAPAYKAPPMMPFYNWSGFYGGLNLGGSWAGNTLSQGPAVDAQGGTINSAGVSGGAQLGFNWLPTPNILLGLEADLDGADLDNNITTTGVAGIARVNWEEKADLYGTVRGRLGYVWNNWLFYGTGGFAWAEDTFTRTQVVSVAISPIPGFTTSNSPGRTGWTAGGGIEWGFAPHWSAKVEYLHLDFSDVGFTFSAPAAGGGTASRSIDEGRLTVDTVRVGVNYHLN